VQLGELDTVTGILKTEFGEWFLSSNDVTYEIHMGDHDHRKEIGINLEEGKKVTAAGFFYQQEDMENVDIAVTALTIDGEEYRFREDDGTPLWRGQGLESGQGPGGGSVGDREGEGHGQGSGHHRHQQN